MFYIAHILFLLLATFVQKSFRDNLSCGLFLLYFILPEIIDNFISTSHFDSILIYFVTELVWLNLISIITSTVKKTIFYLLSSVKLLLLLLVIASWPNIEYILSDYNFISTLLLEVSCTLFLYKTKIEDYVLSKYKDWRSK